MPLATSVSGGQLCGGGSGGGRMRCGPGFSRCSSVGAVTDGDGVLKKGHAAQIGTTIANSGAAMVGSKVILFTL